MKNNYEEDTVQKTLALTICTLISYVPLVSFVQSILRYFVSVGKVDTYIMYFIFLLLLIRSLSIVLKKLKTDVTIMILIFIFAYLLTYLFFPQNRVFMFTSVIDVFENPFYVLFVFSFSGYIFTRYITDYDILSNFMIKFSILVVLCSTTIYFLQLNSGVITEYTEYMTFSYNMTLQTVFLIIMSIEKKKILFFVIGLLGILMILFCGARGPVISILVPLIVYISFRNTSWLKKMGLVAWLTMTFGVVGLFFQNILFFLIDFSEKLGIKSRTLQSILNNTFFIDSGRVLIQNRLINSYTLLGLGLYGDRVVGGDKGRYAHNFFIEIMAQFGYIFGPIVIGIVLYIILNGILSKDSNLKNLAIIFLSTGFIKLFLSGSYLNQEPAFYILLALGVNALYQRKSNGNMSSMN